MRSLALSLLLGPTLALCASSDEWKSRSIYQILTDRFALADGSSPSCDTSERKYRGGTFSGIVNKLDYIQNMGFDAIWISPVVQNVEGDGCKRVLIDNTTYASPYTQLISSILDYPTYFAVFEAFTSTSGNVFRFAETAQQTQKQYKDPFAIGSFIENHDQPREQGYQGVSDPDNREALWLSGYNTENKPLLTHVTKLNAARKAAISSNPDFLSTKAIFHVQQSSSSSTHGLAISKPPLLTLLTNGGEGDSSTGWTVPGNDDNEEGGGGVFEGGETLVDAFTCKEVTVKSDEVLR
ncbi:hypothetical protein K435DRAFT_970758 [Dendrothele bispora CBS 962.96]|uniref:Glycosyl hydrolase family 13 catalytic domain-containing protein n=1 Tax=Dendrothele bispora (strain CBS 962.96) TaxID=1314807 RepID=A0A4S8L9C0_DENBC|nr:hypothetical protein K435DRAFT_970758 [Dendrothele bispora CBS 962.96]